MRIEDLTTYEVLEKRIISDLNSESYIVRHKKTGARLALLSNDDNNKVFYIGFRTPPKDSTGVAHIIEHTVLCGSKDFPIKDPFVELVKGSLNTFLNAMTYPDKTVYPIASCNDADFQNLMHVYLDAVFYPNIYKTDKIFKQEGWHYEMEDEESDLTINGVVYNEMKGAFSSADDVLYREIQNALYPDITYGIESGGDPEVIPELTYDEYLDFHRKYYHPSNSYIYLYGDMDMAEKLEYIDREYLSKFDAQPVDSAVGVQKAFAEPKEVHKKYSILESDSDKQNTFLSYCCSIGTSLDRKLYVAFDILDYALCSAPGAALKKALIEKGIGQEVFSDYDNGIQQPLFAIVAKNADADQKEEFVKTIREVLEDQVKNGIDKKAILAGLSNDEFKYKEADFGRFPKGLLYGLQVLDSWLYDDMKPWIHIEANNTFAELRKEAEGHYFEDLIQEYLLDNTHRTVLLLEPEKGLTEKKDAELADKLKKYKESLSADEIKKIVTETKELKEYQEEPDKPEDLAKIPLLTREDMKKEAEPFKNELRNSNGVDVLYHDIFTNGIGYIGFLFDMSKVPNELLPYATVLKTVLGLLDTENYGYGDLVNEINIKTGGIGGSISSYTNVDDVKKYKTEFEITAKVLYPNISEAFRLVQEILMTSKLDDHNRIKEILDEHVSRMQSDLASSGHNTAAIHGMSYISPTAYITDTVSGIRAYKFYANLAAHFDEKEVREDLTDKLNKLCKILFRKENLMIDFTADEKGYAPMENCIKDFADSLHTETVDTKGFEIKLEKKNEAFQTAGQVQYVCRAGNYINKGLKYDGSLRVLKVMMGYDYLWKNIRVLGGAYGCSSGYGKNGDSYFVTYRDPNLKKSVDVFEKASEYIRNFDADERTITQFIIGAISEIDTPKTPNTKGIYGLVTYLTGTTMEHLQKSRDELLSTTVEKIRSLADYIDAFMQDECICVIGSADKIDEDKELFDSISPLVYNKETEGN